MLIYSGATPEDGAHGTAEAARERLASVQWSRDGQQCVLYLDGSAQALIDFAARTGFCRSNFPNFLDESNPAERNASWRRSSHAWDAAALQRFEAALYS
jgi:hypothetical protein